MKRVTINAWKFDRFLIGLQSVGFKLDELSVKHSDNYERFGMYYNDVLVAKYDERKERGWFDPDAKCRYGKGALMCRMMNFV